MSDRPAAFRRNSGSNPEITAKDREGGSTLQPSGAARPASLTPSRDAASKRSMAKFTAAAEARHNLKPGERHGQAYFNTLYFDGFDPAFADSIRGGPLDPFHDDGRIGPMLDALRRHWDV